MGYRAGQRKGTIIHSKLHFLGVPVPLPHICYRLISSSHCQGIYLDCSRNPDARKPGHTTSSTDPSGAKKAITTQRATDFIISCLQASTQDFKTATYHHQPTSLSSLFGNIQSLMSYQADGYTLIVTHTNKPTLLQPVSSRSLLRSQIKGMAE